VAPSPPGRRDPAGAFECRRGAWPLRIL